MLTFIKNVRTVKNHGKINLYRCSCGKEFETRQSRVNAGFASSCGCKRKLAVSKALTKHGWSQTQEFRAYYGAKRRCTIETIHNYDRYGGRGIKFKFSSFQEFINHIGPKCDPSLSLDRINNDGHYEIGNVRWATKKEQMNNRRPFSQWKKGFHPGKV